MEAKDYSGIEIFKKVVDAGICLNLTKNIKEILKEVKNPINISKIIEVSDIKDSVYLEEVDNDRIIKDDI